MSKKSKNQLLLVDNIEPCIMMIRGQRVILDADLAALYGVPTKALNQAVKRNIERFPADFTFKLNAEETQFMRSQIVTASSATPFMRSQNVTASKRNVRYLPFAFTEHGAIMAASVLNSLRAIEVSVYVVRAFVKLREFLSTHRELAQKLAELEAKVGSHDQTIQSLVSAIRQLMSQPDTKPKRQIGFHAGREVK